eukprot:CAMPEP_0167779070 /NCGR_PEP_ID=MMETSP0111_2-20121227/4608_1 /TAXON_ID=91324 /ORGANISM="Lotharella globosa, Strain CCCM811" /LENGTH=146 /DNA_ID=CAMNT_0007669451 /DNA_START=226 /DNA_END=666 /DNA_ORIENTATION=+
MSYMYSKRAQTKALERIVDEELRDLALFKAYHRGSGHLDKRAMREILENVYVECMRETSGKKGPMSSTEVREMIVDVDSILTSSLEWCGETKGKVSREGYVRGLRELQHVLPTTHGRDMQVVLCGFGTGLVVSTVGFAWGLTVALS